MSVNELRYNLRRMWGRKGFKDIFDVNNGMYFMKFHNAEGLESVVNSGPWMVNNKAFLFKSGIYMSVWIRESMCKYLFGSKCVIYLWKLGLHMV